MTDNNELHLEKINWDNMDAIIRLQVTKEQRNYLASNKNSLVHACIMMTDEGKKVFSFGIYLGKKPVGFIMIDRRYQGNGYGRQAMKLALDFIRTFPAGEAKYCWLSFEPKNEVARNLYRSLGFEEHPEQCDENDEDDEMPAILTL